MMNMTCDYVRSELSAYHDEELPITVRIGISDHLENCPSCAVEAADLMIISGALRANGRAEEVTPMALGRLQ